MNPRRATQAIVIAGTLALATTAHPAAQVVTTAAGNGADSTVAKFDPGANFGEEPAIEIKNAPPIKTGPDFDRKGYFRFDVTGVTRQGVIAASLTFVVTDEMAGPAAKGPQQFSVFGLVDGIDEQWSELGITWNNAPANDTSSGNGVTSDAVRLGGFTLDGTGVPGQIVELSSASLLDFVLADTNGLVTVILVRDTLDADPSGWVHSFGSKEHLELSPPRLTYLDACPADLDGDGTVGFGDLTLLLAAWGPCPGCAEDLAGADGVVGFSDLTILLGGWGPCD